MMTMLAAYQERKLYHECSVRGNAGAGKRKAFFLAESAQGDRAGCIIRRGKPALLSRFSEP